MGETVSMTTWPEQVLRRQAFSEALRKESSEARSLKKMYLEMVITCNFLLEAAQCT